MADAKQPWVALAGNPNTGKTTLFNALTGLSAKVSNYPGVTVDKHHGTIRVDDRTIDVVDIPGTYSLVARSGEERVAVDSLTGEGGAAPAAVVICADATQLARSLYLLLQCQELGLPCLVALTMVDEAGAAAPDPAALARTLGCAVVAIDAKRGQGLDRLRAEISAVIAAPAPSPRWRWQPSAALRTAIDRMRDATGWNAGNADARALWALQSLETDDELDVPPGWRAAAATNDGEGQAWDDEIVAGRWRWLDQHVVPLTQRAADRSATERVDRVLLHRVFGFAVFVGIMFVVFMSLFAWADPAITLVEDAFAWVGDRARDLLGEGIATDFVVDGVIAGMSSILVFLPQILLLFFFLGLLEDCGYLARVAFLMDRIMKSMNLHGRAFVPMLSGFACAVPAVMATRTMERRRDRLLTMMVIPLMTCSARLPVYTLVIAALIPASTTVQSFLMVGIYLFSVVTALIAAWVLSRTIKPLRQKRLPFVIELPPYRLPRLVDVMRMMWGKASVFVREAGGVILVCTIALWALLYFPRELPASEPDYAALIEAAPTEEARAALEQQEAAARLHHSYAGRLGRAIEPAIEPLGFDWKIGIGVIGAFAAREVFVSTMGVVYSLGGDVDENDAGLRAALRDTKRANGAPAYSALTGLSLMMLTPCTVERGKASPTSIFSVARTTASTFAFFPIRLSL